MKTLAVVLVALTSFINLTYAQEESASFMKETTPEQRAQFQTNYMKENLTLTSQQENKVHEVNLRYAQKIQDAYGAQGKEGPKTKKDESHK